MDDYIITFRSVTPAQRGEAQLRQMGFLCRLQRTPKWMETQGCGYSIRMQGKQIGDAVKLLQERKIPFRKVYRVNKSGGTEEIAI